MMDDKELKIRLLLKTLLSPEFAARFAPGTDPAVYKDKNFSVKLYRDMARMRKEMAQATKDPALFEAMLGSLEKPNRSKTVGLYDAESRTVFSPYDAEALEHELRHHFYPEVKHRPGLSVREEWEQMRPFKQQGE